MKATQTDVIRGKTVMVVDDEASVRDILKVYLGELGLSVIPAASVAFARECLESFSVDLILSDISMPGGESGIDLLRWCREAGLAVPFILISGFIRSEDVRSALALGVHHVIHKPFDRQQLTGAVMSSFAISDSYSQLVNRYVEQIERNNMLFLAAIEGFAAAVGARDGYTLEHSRQVADFAVLLSRKLELDEKFTMAARIAGELHDIGKIGVPERILLKEALLTGSEYSVMKTHPEKSADILKPVPNMEEVIKGARHHHERYDGKGYPDGLAGEGIPLLGRILAVCDAFSAMITERPYRPAITTEDARSELKNGRGTQFEPLMVDAFLSIPEILEM
jgi:putative two-component system response regulator